MESPCVKKWMVDFEKWWKIYWLKFADFYTKDHPNKYREIAQDAYERGWRDMCK